MRKTFLFYFVVLTVFLVGCSNQQLYEAIQADRIQQCELEISDAAREACLEGYGQSYEDYEDARTAEIEN